MVASNVEIPTEKIADFCRRWKVTEFALFGSVLRDDFSPTSDIDVLVTFSPDARWTLLNLADAADELERLFGRRVDLLERPAVQAHHNPWLKHEILSNAKTVYRAA